MATLKEKFTTWFDQHGLFALSLFLLVFIPLYPKIPLAEAIPGYLVRIRLEDLLVFGVSGIWFIQLLRKKVEWKTSFHFIIIGYALIGLLSLVVAIGLQQTIPPHFAHLSKSVLHYFRYLEYFTLFVIFYSSIKDKKHTQIAINTLLAVLGAIFIYGVGQRYLQWPAFSTMNREFSKGAAQVLAPTTKLHSTFGGHYDLAAYLVIIMPIMTAWILRNKNKIEKILFSLGILGGFWLLKESASKMALAATLFSMGGVVWFSLYQKWGAKKSILVSLFAGLIISGSAIGGLWIFSKPTLYKFAPFLRPAGYQTPIDVVGELDETWSENARKYGLSMGIRLDTLWPNALRSFSTNPFTGKGYATLNKVGDEFVEADSTDNNFLRVLGETGLIGFVTFFGLIILIIKTLTLKLPKNNLDQALVVGFIASTVGLFINGLIIDVFSASKVAFTYWALAGLIVKNFYLKNKNIVEKKESKRFKKTLDFIKNNWPILITSIVLILLVHKQPFTEYSLVKSFDVSEQQAKYVATTKCLFDGDSWRTCVDDYQPSLGIIYSVFLLPFYAIYNEPAMFYFANLILIIGSTLLLNSILNKFIDNKLTRFLLLLTVVTTPSIYSLPIKSSPINLWIFLLLLLGNSFSLKIKPKFVSKKVNYLLILITMVHLILVQYFLNMTGGIIKSYRDEYRPSNFVAIRKANSYLTQKETQPILLTIINPTIFDLYAESGYTTQPFDNHNFANHKDLINQNQELYITNANINKSLETKEVFEKYKHDFGIQLKEIECRHECNFYQLLAEDVTIPTKPETWNSDVYKINEDNFSFLVINNELVKYLGQTTLTKQKNIVKQNLISQKPDLIFSVGNGKNDYEKNHGKAFLRHIDLNLNTQIIAVLGNKNAFGPQYQIFEVGENWIITLDANQHHSSAKQNIFIYDALLQLEKHPKIKNIIIISENPEWLDRHPDNYWFAEDFPKQLSKHPGVNFKLFFSLSQTEERIKNLYSHLPENVQLIDPAEDEFSFNSYLKVEFNNGELVIKQNKFITN